MKDSGVEWIGEIPEDWKVVSTKFLFDIFSGATPDSSNPEYWEGNIRWITPADYKSSDVYVDGGRRNLSQKGFESCSTSMIPPGNIIFSKRAPIGSVAINLSELCTNQGCLACVCKGVEVAKYYYYVMSVATKQYELLGSGTTFKEISALSFANFKLPLPNNRIQNEISRYLDGKCTQVDTLIANVQTQIEKLKAYKQSLITEVVTKGLDPTVPMKNSGVEWIGEIPLHWDIKRGKVLFKESDARSPDGSEELLTVSQYTGITPRSQKNVNMFEALTLEGYKICEIGDIAANTMWLWAGAIGVSAYKGVISPSYNVYRQKTEIFAPDYLDCLLRAPMLVQEYASRSTGIRASRLRLYPKDFLDIMFPVPPLKEQKHIMNVLSKKFAAVDKLIAIKQSKIEKLEQYKKSLIYEYVTGKKEVI